MKKIVIGLLFGVFKKFFVILQRLSRKSMFHRVSVSRLSNRIVLWCNGSTTVFGSVCLGSNPGKTTQEANRLKRRQLAFPFSHTYHFTPPPDKFKVEL